MCVRIARVCSYLVLDQIGKTGTLGPKELHPELRTLNDAPEPAPEAVLEQLSTGGPNIFALDIKYGP